MLKSAEPHASQHSSALALWMLWILLGLSLGTGIAAYLLPNQLPVVLGIAAFFAVTATVFLRGRLRRQGRQMQLAAQTLPEWKPAPTNDGWTSEFAATADALRV